MLEHHTRAFILDKLLAALGWRSEADAGGPSNIFTEAFLKSAQAISTTLFLDYLGFDARHDMPLLVFEAKRFSTQPPKYLIKLGFSSKPEVSYSSSEEALNAAFKNNDWLQGDWKEHVGQLIKYYNAILKEYKHPPTVMAIGNGQWLVIIKKPALVFNGKGTAACFSVFEPEVAELNAPVGEVYVKHFKDIYEELAFDRICKRADGVTPELMPTVIKTANNVEIMRGVRVGYSSVHKLKSAIRPQLEIEPVAFVRVPTGQWILVEINAEGIDIPHAPKFLNEHLSEVKKRSDELLDRIRKNLQNAPSHVPLLNHYSDLSGFTTRLGVTAEGTRKHGIESYILVTGAESHFILDTPRVTNCPKHIWGNCDPVSDGRHPPQGALSAPSYLDTKAFFAEGRDHHCAAATTHGAKLVKYDKLKVSVFGQRSSEDGEPFCEIFDFEEMLCCQTCVFFEVCAKSKVFKLPCT